MKSGDIIFVTEKGLIPWLIRFFDRGKFSHVTIAVDDKNILEAQYGMKSSIVPFSYADYEIVSLGLSDEQRKQVSEIAPTLTGHRYDFVQVFSIFLRDVWNKNMQINNSPNNYICSEIVEILLQKIGAIPKDKNIRNLTPNQLYEYLKKLT